MERKFLSSWDLISKQGFNSNFKKMWDFYFSYCDAGFKSKNIDLINFHFVINEIITTIFFNFVIKQLFRK